jgi:hypothetical protein
VNNRIWILGTAVVCIGVILVGWLIGIQPRIASISSNNLALIESQGRIQENRAKLEALKKQYSNLDAVRTELAELRVALPADGDYQAFIEELSSLANESNSSLTGYAWSAPSYYIAPVEGSKTDKTVVPTDPNSLLVIPITIQAQSTSLESLLKFLNGVQFGDRLVLIASYSIIPAPNATKGITYTLSMDTLVYSLVDPASFTQPSTVDPAVPTPTETPTPTDTPAPGGTPSSTPNP